MDGDYQRVIVATSGGKDSTLAVAELRAAGLPVSGLLCTMTEGFERVSMHGVRQALMVAQAAALGLPLHTVWIPQNCPNAVYEQRMAASLAALVADGADAIAFGDLFLQDVRAYREQRMAGNGLATLFPLWGKDTTKLAQSFISQGYEAILVTVDPRQIPAELAGRPYDRQLLADLPPSADPCGENGEFHTFVCNGPIFQTPLMVERGEVVERDGFTFADLTLTAHQATT
ncbi:MAG: Dph6-related ATP pyrophosphatase [Sulfobacillus sp.]